MQSPLQSPTAATDPKSVKVNLSTGTGVDIEWNDGHVSHFSFVYLRDACPCAMCTEERDKSGRNPGEPRQTAPGMLPMFKAAAKPVSAEAIGKYAIRFAGTMITISAFIPGGFLRELCPCEECRAANGTAVQSARCKKVNSAGPRIAWQFAVPRTSFLISPKFSTTLWLSASSAPKLPKNFDRIPKSITLSPAPSVRLWRRAVVTPKTSRNMPSRMESTNMLSSAPDSILSHTAIRIRTCTSSKSIIPPRKPGNWSVSPRPEFAIPSSMTFVPVDFEHQTLGAELGVPASMRVLRHFSPGSE